MGVTVRISRLEIRNFRAFEYVDIAIDEYTCFVGPNGAGKSTILNALNVLFRDQRDPTNVNRLEEEDFHLKRTERPIEIKATLVDLSDDARDELSAYIRQDKLIIKAKAEWNPDTEEAEVEQFGVREVIKDFAPYFEAEDSGAYAKDLKAIYKDIQAQYPELPDEHVKAEMRAALRTYEEDHPALCEPVDSTDQFYGWSRGKNKLDNYFQWVYVPAVKDPTDEEEEGRDTALGQLLSRTIRSKIDFESPLSDLRADVSERYREILASNEGVLESLEASIEARLREWSHPAVTLDLHWHFDPEKSVSVTKPSARAKVGEGPFSGELVRLGHGLQRSFLVAVLYEEAVSESEERPTLLLGIEEPELYQHPPQARHLAAVLDQLAEGNAQALITTHSPYFVSAEGFESIRMTRKDSDSGAASVRSYSHTQLSEDIADALGDEVRPPTSTMAAVEQIMRPSRNELYFARIPILVEGAEDIAFISTHLKLTGRWEEFRRHGCHFIECDGKTNLSRPLGIANGLGVPAFVICDGDTDRVENGSQQERDNQCIINLTDEGASTLPDEDYFGDRLVIWSTRIGDTVRNDLGVKAWNEAEDAAREEHRLRKGVQGKHPMLIAAILEHLYQDGGKSAKLSQCCARLLDFAADKSTGV